MVWGKDTLSHMLEDRVLGAIDVYERGGAKKILMSGYHGQEDYDEVNAMKKYAVEKGVAADDVFMDHAGFSTYETMYRARDVFQAKKVVIVTQKYHLYRAVYIARLHFQICIDKAVQIPVHHSVDIAGFIALSLIHI